MIMALTLESYIDSIMLSVFEHTKLDTTRIVFSFITDRVDIVNKKGNPYVLDSQTIDKWFSGKDQIPKTILGVLHEAGIENTTEEHFDEHVLEILSSLFQEQTYESIIKLINEDDAIPQNKKEYLIRKHEQNETAYFLALSFLYALGKKPKNKISYTKKATKLSSALKDVVLSQEKVHRIPSPKQLIPPEVETEADFHLPYVTELFNAYADSSGIDAAVINNLLSHSNNRKHFERQRKYYYQAESINQSARDIFPEDGENEFEALKDDTYDGIIEICEENHPNCLKRVNAVMKHVSTLKANKSLLNYLPSWLGIGEQKGVCHILVNEERINWRGIEDEII